MLDLPFTAVEWVLPGELSTWHSFGSDSWMVWERSPLARERSLMGYWDDADDHQIAAAAAEGGAADGPAAGKAGALRQTHHQCLRSDRLDIQLGNTDHCLSMCLVLRLTLHKLLMA